MNRKQRRENGVTTKDPIYQLKSSEIKKMKDEAAAHAIDAAFFLMLSIPVTVIHNNFGQLRRKEGREELFADLCIELYDKFNKEEITLDELKNTLSEQCGIELPGGSN